MYTININGNITGADEARVSVLDRGFLYGDSVYEVAQVCEGHPLFLEEHLDRLELSAERIGMKIQGGRYHIKKEIEKTIKAHNRKNCYVRAIVTRGEGELTLDPDASTDNNLVIIVKDLPQLPQEWQTQGISVIIPSVIRNSKVATDPNIKSGNYLNNILAMKEA